jgi:hypothetical protein
MSATIYQFWFRLGSFCRHRNMRSVARAAEHRLAQWVSELAPRCPRDRDLAVCPGFRRLGNAAFVLPVATPSDFVLGGNRIFRVRRGKIAEMVLE